ncbi:ATP-binding protein, partial [Myxococcota bacterium]|nr:ATP-binding protein [Myxococcota bacterium]
MNTEREAELLDRIAKLELQLERADKVKRTLMERVERSIDASDGAFAVFERNIILQQAVEARTAELAELNRRLLVEISAREEIERHLERSRDEALAAGRAKSEFVANMSHEVRTPMNGILGMVELMLRTALSTRQREYARTIQRSAEALLAVLDDILDFSKIEAGKMSIDPQPFDLGLAIEDVAELFMPRIEEKGLQLVVKCDPTLPPRVVGDPARIRQVITNLVGNAVKFTERGKVTLSLVCIDHTARGARVMVSVSDTGIGIPRDRLDAIFERFTQADSSTTRRYGGAGLGLTISRRLVELMGGEIGVESDIGRGSTFWFKLLLPVPEAQASGASDAAEPVIPQSLGRPLRVLVVEDNDVNRVVAMQLLAELGCLCDVATNGEAAIQLTERTSYDVVFMDCQMPGLDGFEATARIRQREAEAGGHLPIVALTANAMAGARERCTAAGMDDYLAKPVTLTTLGRALARHAPGGATQP